MDDGIDVNDAEDSNVRIPLEADQLIVHSTTEGQRCISHSDISCRFYAVFVEIQHTTNNN